MGLNFSACQNAERPVSTKEWQDLQYQFLEKVENVKEKVAEEETALQHLAEDMAKAGTKVKELVHDVKEDVQKVLGGGEAVQEAAEEVKDEAAATEAAAEKVEGDAVVVEEKTQGLVAAVGEIVAPAADFVEKFVEGLEETVDGLRGAADVVVCLEFVEGKDTVHKVEVKRRTPGFDLFRSSVGCCGKASKPKVVVAKVQKDSQAEQLGIKRSWVLKQVDGTEVTGLEQARSLLTKSLSKLPEA